MVRSFSFFLSGEFSDRCGLLVKGLGDFDFLFALSFCEYFKCFGELFLEGA
jgi:hypothetical protein